MNRLLFSLLFTLLLPAAAVAQITSSPQTVNGPLVVQGNAYVNGGGLCVNPLGSTGGNAGGICMNALNNQVTSGGNLGFPIAGTLGLTLGTTGGATLGSPTGGMPSVGVLNAQGIEINGQSFSTIPGSSPITPEGGTVPSSLAALLGRTVNVLDHGAKCDGTTDDTTAIQTAINAVQTAGGGIVQFPAANCLVKSTLNVTAAGITLQGENWRASVLTCQTGAADCIDVAGSSMTSQIAGDWIDNLHISGTNLTGGALVSYRFAVQGGMHNVILDHPYNGWEASGINDLLFDNVDLNATAGGAFGFKWYSAVTGERSDVIDMRHVTVNENGDSPGGDCITWDGDTNTLWMSHVNLLGCNNGLHIEDTSGSTTQFPQFLQAFDLEVDAATGFSLVTDSYASQLYCDQCQLTSQSGTDFAVALQTNTSNVTISNSRLLSGTGTNAVGIYSGATAISLIGNNYYGSGIGNVINNSGSTISFVGGEGYNGSVITVTSCATGTTC